MSAEWLSTTIQEFVDRGEVALKTGPFGTQLHASDYVEHGTPVINVRNIGFGSIVPEKLEYISDQTVRRLESHLLKANDIVFGRKGAVERHAFIRSTHDKWFQGSDCLRLRAESSNLVPRFLSYCFLTEDHKQWIMNQCSHGATMASLNQAILCRIPLRLPPPSIQRRIASILSAYDDLIENNTRRIQILEEMAQRIYREWFVHFRFPGHENVKMVESELGLIPEGWNIRSLGDLTSLVTKGTTPTTLGKQFTSLGVNFVKVESIAESGTIIMNKLAKIDNETHELLRRSQLCKDDILFSIAGAIGRVALVPFRVLPANTNQALAIIRCADLDFVTYLLATVRSPLFQNFNSGRVVQTAQANVSLSILKSAPILVPPKSLCSKFQALAEPILRFVDVLASKNENLRTTRDFLLPKLISGEVSVDATEEAQEAVV